MPYPSRYVPAIRETESDCNPAVRWRSRRLVTLLEILETSAEAWWRLASMTGQLMVRLERSIPPLDSVIETLAELAREVGRLDLPLSEAQLLRIRDELPNFANVEMAIVAERLRGMVVEVNMRVWDELKNRFFLTIPAQEISLYRQQEPLFGKDVEAAFPEMSEDISEAGKCLALGRSTAAVFHLMRVMEIAVHRYGDALAIKLASEKNWQVILNEANKAVKALDQKAENTRALAEALAHLYNVKLCWRNAVMHPKQTYTLDEARGIFLAAKAFVADLIGVLSLVALPEPG